MTREEIEAIGRRQHDGLLISHGCSGIVLTAEERDALMEMVLAYLDYEKTVPVLRFEVNHDALASILTNCQACGQFLGHGHQCPVSLPGPARPEET